MAIDKERINDLFDIWIDTIAQREVGWPSESMLAKFMLYRGSFQDQHRPMGLEQFVDRQVIRHAKFADIQVALEELETDRAMAIIARRYYLGLGDNNRTYNNKDRASKIGQRLREFENNLSQAYKNIAKTLQILDRRKKIN